MQDIFLWGGGAKYFFLGAEIPTKFLSGVGVWGGLKIKWERCRFGRSQMNLLHCVFLVKPQSPNGKKKARVCTKSGVLADSRKKGGFPHFLALFLESAENPLLAQINVFAVWALRLDRTCTTLTRKILQQNSVRAAGREQETGSAAERTSEGSPEEATAGDEAPMLSIYSTEDSQSRHRSGVCVCV